MFTIPTFFEIVFFSQYVPILLVIVEKDRLISQK